MFYNEYNVGNVSQSVLNNQTFIDIFGIVSHLIYLKYNDKSCRRDLMDFFSLFENIFNLVYL